MTPAIWLDEYGQRQPIRSCPNCGRKSPVLRLRYEHLLMNGWKPMNTMQLVNWCGHSQEFVAWPEADGYWRLVPMLGDATFQGRVATLLVLRSLSDRDPFDIKNKA
jgi:hypothetical protein